MAPPLPPFLTPTEDLGVPFPGRRARGAVSGEPGQGVDHHDRAQPVAMHMPVGTLLEYAGVELWQR